MSIQNARDFLSKVANDEEFRNGLGRCQTAAEQQQYAITAGYEFTAEEFGAARTELQDADLDVVSGGCSGCDVCPQVRG